jgi:uncharacterized membrane-anchored protein
MNLNKKAEIFLGMNTTDFFIFAALAAVSGLLTFILYMITKAGVISLIVFAFLAANAFLAVGWYKRQPDGFIKNFFEYMNTPSIYLPGRRDDDK